MGSILSPAVAGYGDSNLCPKSRSTRMMSSTWVQPTQNNWRAAVRKSPFEKRDFSALPMSSAVRLRRTVPPPLILRLRRRWHSHNLVIGDFGEVEPHRTGERRSRECQRLQVEPAALRSGQDARGPGGLVTTGPGARTACGLLHFRQAARKKAAAPNGTAAF